MSSQGSLFTPAVEHKARGVQALHELNVGVALPHLRSAQEIDPGLENLDILIEATEFLHRAGATPESDRIKLSRLWVQARATYVTGDLRLLTLSVVEYLICQAAVRSVSYRFRGYLDPDRRGLHIGYCYLVLGDAVRAHRKLFDDLASRPLGGFGDLWGYLGDAALELKFTERANHAYVRALFGDPDGVDVGTLHHVGLYRLYHELRNEHKERLARHLLPIHAWIEALVRIPADDHAFANYVRRFLQRVNRVQDQDEGDRYRRFALLLYKDQVCEGLFDLSARTEMESIDAALFSRYLQEAEMRERHSRLR